MSATSTKRISTRGRPIKKSTLCMDCDRILGCPWMMFHLPVPGWTAKRTYIIESTEGSQRRGDARVRLNESYHVTQCPIYVDPMEVRRMQTKKQGIKKYTHRGETTYRARCGWCGYKLPVIADNLDDLEAVLEKAGWQPITGGALMCPACQAKNRRD